LTCRHELIRDRWISFIDALHVIAYHPRSGRRPLHGGLYYVNNEITTRLRVRTDENPKAVLLRSRDRLRKPAVCSLKDIVEWLKVGTFKHAGTCSTEVIVRYLSLPSARHPQRYPLVPTGILTLLKPLSLIHLQSSSFIQESQCGSSTCFAFPPLATSKSLFPGGTAPWKTCGQIHRSRTNQDPKLTPRCFLYRGMSLGPRG